MRIRINLFLLKYLPVQIQIQLFTWIQIQLPKIPNADPCVIQSALEDTSRKKEIILYNQWWGSWTFRFWRSSQAGTTFFELLKHVHVKVSILRYPVLRIRIFSSWIPDSGSASKKLSILTQKLLLSSRKNDPGCSSQIRIRILFFYTSRIPDPGVKKSPDPRSATQWESKYKTLPVWGRLEWLCSRPWATTWRGPAWRSSEPLRTP